MIFLELVAFATSFLFKFLKIVSLKKHRSFFIYNILNIQHKTKMCPIIASNQSALFIYPLSISHPGCSRTLANSIEQKET